MELLIRYSRQIILPGWSLNLQEEISRQHALVSPPFRDAAYYLAALGIGRISLTERDPLLVDVLGRFRSDLEMGNDPGESPPDVVIGSRDERWNVSPDGCRIFLAEEKPLTQLLLTGRSGDAIFTFGLPSQWEEVLGPLAAVLYCRWIRGAH